MSAPRRAVTFWISPEHAEALEQLAAARGLGSAPLLSRAVVLRELDGAQRVGLSADVTPPASVKDCGRCAQMRTSDTARGACTAPVSRAELAERVLQMITAPKRGTSTRRLPDGRRAQLSTAVVDAGVELLAVAAGQVHQTLNALVIEGKVDRIRERQPGDRVREASEIWYAPPPRPAPLRALSLPQAKALEELARRRIDERSPKPRDAQHNIDFRSLQVLAGRDLIDSTSESARLTEAGLVEIETGRFTRGYNGNLLARDYREAYPPGEERPSTLMELLAGSTAPANVERLAG